MCIWKMGFLSKAKFFVSTSIVFEGLGAWRSEGEQTDGQSGVRYFLGSRWRVESSTGYEFQNRFILSWTRVRQFRGNVDYTYIW